MISLTSLFCFFATVLFIPFIKKNAHKIFKNPSQPIRNDLIIDHSSKKHVLPLGGLVMFVSFILGFCILFAMSYFKYKTLPANTILVSILVVCCVFVLGFIDDFAKISKRNTKGVSGKLRFWIEFIIGLAFAYFIVATPTLQQDISIALPIPFHGIVSYKINPWFYIVFKAFVFAACLNAFNITDGLDGLATTQFLQFAIAFLIIFLIQIVSGANIGSGASTVIYFLTLFSFICLGFLCFNSHPATIFMGDSGSLMLGSVVGISSMLCNFEFSLLFLAFIPFCETLSVILQVLSFRLRKGKRIFKIAPIHHHFEATGHKETKIVYNFLICSVVISSIFIGSIFLI